MTPEEQPPRAPRACYWPDRSLDEWEALLGTMPNGAPAAWWYSTHPDNLTGAEQYRTDMEVWRERCERLCETVGVDPKRARVNHFGNRTTLIGLEPGTLRDAPPHWRIDSKHGYLVPSRRTKADRESDAGREFAALIQVPNILTYMQGMPEILWLPTRMYSVDIRHSPPEAAVLAFCSADPDRLSPGDRRDFTVDETRWCRLPLSLYHLLREGQS